MITGIGIDLIGVGKFRAMHDPDGFMSEVLSQEERAAHPGIGRDPVRAAALFAVKEAVLKAIGCGLAHGSYWHDVRIDGAFRTTISGALRRMAGNLRSPAIHVSYASSNHYVAAIVLIEESA